MKKKAKIIVDGRHFEAAIAAGAANRVAAEAAPTRAA
jgi:hypothetical protein